MDGIRLRKAAIHLRDENRDRRRAENEVRRQAQTLRAVLDSAGEGIAVADESGRFSLFNPMAERILGKGITSEPVESWRAHYNAFLPDGVTPVTSEQGTMLRALRGEATDDVEWLFRNESHPEGVPAGQRMRLEVRDTGPGIPAAALDKVFTPFERLGAEQSGVEGAGIGLSICQRLVEVMGGRIGVESVENEGCTFWIELPRAEDPVAAQENSESQTPDADQDPSPRLAHTVLCIEDNLSNLKLIERVLARRPENELVAAMQGRRGLEMAREQKPDLILLDLHLPDIPGDEVLHHLRAQAETREIPVVMLSAAATPHQIERLKAAGAREYLTKPLDVKHFLQVIGEIMVKENA